MSRKGSRSSRSLAKAVSRSARQRGQAVLSRPAFGTRLSDRPAQSPFDAPERWHEPRGRTMPRIIVEPPGREYFHPITPSEVRARILELPERFHGFVDVIQFSRMTRKRRLFPLYGLQWGTAVYLYPIEESLVETFVQPPRPQQAIETRMYGGRWAEEDGCWRLYWTRETIRDFYLNNILIHEIGHALDVRNRRPQDRERFANWFAVEYGYRRSERPSPEPVPPS
ncbi:MAG: hypothetical protein KF774_16735 [Planctomyces sp.]|nr:hypothetical protein [Planctomyces sp.]